MAATEPDNGCRLARTVIVWINGAFGVGKTTVARRLVERCPGARMFDPELLGFVLGRLMRNPTRDFQDLPSWRRGTLRLVRGIARFQRVVVVPMTVAHPDYFEEIVGELRRTTEVRHFTLQARPSELRARIRQRGHAVAWSEAHLERCVTALADARFAEHVNTDARTVDSIVTDILAALPASNVSVTG